MQIILSALDPALAEAWETHCGDLDCVTVHQGSITDLECDAVVSPANSFGFMDGGIDAVYSRHFGPHVQDRLQALIRDKHSGELLVGHAEIVPTDDHNIPYLIAAPTMRVPMILKDSVNPYLATRAVLLLAKYGMLTHKYAYIAGIVKSVAFPGLGTGVGRVAPDVCAKQVRAAIEAVLMGAPFPNSWHDAQECHQNLYSDDVRDLQF